MTLSSARLLFIGLLCIGLVRLLPAQTDVTAYKCTAASGQVSFQDAPCAHSQQQQTLSLQDSEPTIAPAPAAASSTHQVATAPPAPPPHTPPALMYRCIRATDGTAYLSSNGHPAPYYVPLGMSGLIPSTLSQTYTAANQMGHGMPTAALIASRYTPVQDQCVPMSPQETCQALRDQYDDNERKLSRAFQSDQPPLLQRESELRAQLTHC